MTTTASAVYNQFLTARGRRRFLSYTRKGLKQPDHQSYQPPSVRCGKRGQSNRIAGMQRNLGDSKQMGRARGGLAK